MNTKEYPQVTLCVETKQWALRRPLRIKGHVFTSHYVIVVTLEREGMRGRGEAAGVYYLQDDVASMSRQIDVVRATIEVGIDRDALQHLLPPGGARNALDCALWELEAQLSGRPVWQIAGLDAPAPLVTTYTLGADTPSNMATCAGEFADARALKLKLTGESADADRVSAVRSARPDVWLSIDANQGYSRATLERILPALIEADVKLIEQPLPIGQDTELSGLGSPIPIAADESVQSSKDLELCASLFDVVNIKLDKCGGLTEGLAMIRRARQLGLELMVGNMCGTSLAMAPAFLLGQLCSVVDLDGPLLLQNDCFPCVSYERGVLHCPDDVWGGPSARSR